MVATEKIVVGGSMGILLVCIALIVMASLHVFSEKKTNGAPVISPECAAVWPPKLIATGMCTTPYPTPNQTCPATLPTIPPVCQ
jgi:hypothetical protein